MFLKIGDTVEVSSYVDEEADEPRTDLVGKIGTVKEIDSDDEIITVLFEGDDEGVLFTEDVVFYAYELHKI